MRMNRYSLKPFDGAVGIPQWVIDMANSMDKKTVETQTGQWLVKRNELGRYEFFLLVATDR